MSAGISAIVFSFIHILIICSPLSLASCTTPAGTVRTLDANTSTTRTSTASGAWTNLQARLHTPSLSYWQGKCQVIARGFEGLLYITALPSTTWHRPRNVGLPHPVAVPDVSASSVPAQSAYVVATTDVNNEVVVSEYISGKWLGFRRHGGSAAEGVGVSAWDSDNVHLFSIGYDNGLHYRQKKDGIWLPWTNLKGFIISTPGVVAASATKAYVVTKSKYNYLEFNVYDDGVLKHSKGFDFYATSAAAVTLTGDNRVDVFVRGEDFALWTVHSENVMDNGGWSKWTRIGGAFATGPAAVARGDGVIEVAAADCNNMLHHLKWHI